MRRKHAKRLGLTFLLMLFLAPVAFGQGAPPQQQEAPNVEVNDDELETIAEVYVQIEAVQQEYRPEFQQAETEEEAQQLRSQLQQEVNQVIEAEEDVTVERYDKVIRAAQADPELGNKLIAAIEAAREDNG